MERYTFEGKRSYKTSHLTGLAPGYEIIDSRRGRDQPIAETKSVDDAVLLVDALNTRALLVDSVDR